MRKRSSALFVGNFINHIPGGIDELARGHLLGIDVVYDIAADAKQSSHQRLFPHDSNIYVQIFDGGNALRQIAQISQLIDRKLVALLKFFSNRNEVDGLAYRSEVIHRAENPPVRFSIKVIFIYRANCDERTFLA